MNQITENMPISLNAGILPNAQTIPSPRSLSSLLDGAFDVYKAKFRTLFLAVSIIGIPTQLALYTMFELWIRPDILYISTPQGSSDTGAVLLFLVKSGIVGYPPAGIPGLLAIAAFIINSAPISLLIARSSFGRNTSFKDAFQQGLSRSFALLTSGFLAGTAIIAVAGITLLTLFTLLGLVITVIGVKMLGAEITGWITNISMILILLFTYMACALIVTRFFLFAAPLLTIEKMPLSQLWERNAQLTSRPRLLRMWIATAIVPVLLIFIQLLLFLSLDSTLKGLHPPQMIQILASAFFTTLFTLFFEGYLFVLIPMLYLDCRVRREALDIRAAFEEMSS